MKRTIVITSILVGLAAVGFFGVRNFLTKPQELIPRGWTQDRIAVSDSKTNNPPVLVLKETSTPKAIQSATAEATQAVRAESPTVGSIKTNELISLAEEVKKAELVEKLTSLKAKTAENLSKEKESQKKGKSGRSIEDLGYPPLPPPPSSPSSSQNPPEKEGHSRDMIITKMVTLYPEKEALVDVGNGITIILREGDRYRGKIVTSIDRTGVIFDNGDYLPVGFAVASTDREKKEIPSKGFSVQPPRVETPTQPYIPIPVPPLPQRGQYGR